MSEQSAKVSSDNPVLNNPYEEPKYYYDTDLNGNIDYSTVINGRRPFGYDVNIVPNKRTPTTVSKESDRAGRKQKPFLSMESIDTYFKQRRLCNDVVPTAIYKYAERELAGDLWNYFLQCYNEHTEYRQSIGKKKQKDTMTSSALRGASLGSDVVFGKHSGSSRQPRFGYARDKYGRIQERDHLDEERRNEFRQAQRRQSGSDFSSYDPEDDHDSYYESGGYD